MNDYGHHPTEIRATLRAIKECFATNVKRITVVFQPHRYSRTRLCWDELLKAFGDADKLILSEIYAANEEPIVGVSGENLFREVVHTDKEFCPRIDELPNSLATRLEDGDLVLFLGAGPVGLLPERLVSALQGEALGGADQTRNTATDLKVISGGR